MTKHKYALIVDNDVFGMIEVEDNPEINPNGIRLVSGLSSDPKIVEVDSNSDITHGWNWDGTNFTPPQE
jgi:hypothetical protein